MFRYTILFILLYCIGAQCNEFHKGRIDLKLGNRFFITSFLENIFGKENISSSPTGLYKASGEKHPLTVEYILSKRGLWGGPCDVYDMSENDMGDLEYPIRNCHLNGTTINPGLMVQPSIIREGYRIKSCEEIVNMDSAVSHALARVDLLDNSQGNNQNITKLYSLFHPTRKLAGEDFSQSINSLQLVFNASDSAIEGWRHVLLTLCFDPSWQVL